MAGRDSGIQVDVISSDDEVPDREENNNRNIHLPHIPEGADQADPAADQPGDTDTEEEEE